MGSFSGSFSIAYMIYTKKKLCTLFFTLSLLLPVSAFAVESHQFKYTPDDQGNSTAVANFSTVTDSNGRPYWQQTGSAGLVETGITWTTQNYVYIFVEGNATPLYNQAYIYGSSTKPNLSCYGACNHPPDKLATFTVDGHTISMYRFYTEAGLTFTNFTVGSFGQPATNLRIYGAVASSGGAPPVTDQATMYAYLSSFVDFSTHIVSFLPADGVTYSSSTPVSFYYDVYINPADIGQYSGVRIVFHNIDQNVILSTFSNNDIVFYNQFRNDASGDITFSSSTMLSAGNYRIEISLDKEYIGGVFRNPFSSVNDTQSHQFIVGASTFLGNISQNAFTQSQSIYNSFTGTSTANLSSSCNVINGFDTMRCIAFLFVPSGDQLSSVMTSFKNNALSKMPWGYVTRMYTILSFQGTSTLPTLAMSIPTGANTHETVHFDLTNMVTGGGTNLDSVTSNINHVTVRQVLSPFVSLMVALGVVFTIVTDLMGSHKEADSGGGSSGGGRRGRLAMEITDIKVYR